MTTPTITRLKLPAVRQYVESRAWAIHKEKGLALLEVLEVHAQGGGFTAEEIRTRVAAAGTYGGRGNAKPITKTGGTIAVLPLYGVIAQRMDMMMEFCGGTSAERFADEFDAAMADPNVVAIVIDVDSPGGTVQGTPELAKRIFDARGKGKQLIAVSNGCMASAAYWIGSACDEVVASPSAETGSIGVYTVHVDTSGYNEQLGLKYTLIKGRRPQGRGNPWEPLSETPSRSSRARSTRWAPTFVAAVAKHRGKKASEVNANFGQGRCFTAKQALAAGMIDRIATLEETLGKLGAKDVGMSGRPPRAFGQAAATMNDRGLVETPI
jgi:signal peptide peptidase SppA